MPNREYHPNLVQWIRIVLQTLPQVNRVMRIILRAHDILRNDDDRQEWTWIDTLLGERNVRVEVRYIGTVSLAAASLRTRVISGMPRLVSKGYISVYLRGVLVYQS